MKPCLLSQISVDDWNLFSACEHTQPLDTDRVNPSTLVRSLVTIIEAYMVKAKRKQKR